MANLFESLQEMSKVARVTLFMAIACLLIGTSAAFLWVSNETYGTLFTDLEPRDSAAVIEQLEQMKVEYQLGSEGRQILIPESRVHEIRLKLTGAGIPLGGGVGFEIFDSSDFGMTEFSQRINYQRALEGELTRTIMSLDEVKYARVHLVMPEKGLFKQKDLVPSASVTLFLKNEYIGTLQLNSSQIIGIQRLVSASVPQLMTENVTVTDQAGNTLSQQVETDSANAAISTQLRLKQTTEVYLTEKVNKVLLHSFGENLATASVDVEINFDEVRQTLENVISPEGAAAGVVKSRENRTWAGGKQPDGGIIKEVEYKLGRTVEQIVKLPGKIQRLNVSVVVPEGVSPTKLIQIKDLVEKTVGLNVERGDAISIQAVSIAKDEIYEGPPIIQAPNAAPESESKVVKATEILDLLLAKPEYIAVSIGALLLFVFLVVILFQWRKPVVVNTPKLSREEREKALEKLNNWLDVPPSRVLTQGVSDGNL